MIRHYDMTTGEALADQGHDEPAQVLPYPDDALSLRLMTVREAAAMRPREVRLPVDIAHLPVAMILADQS